MAKLIAAILLCALSCSAQKIAGNSTGVGNSVWSNGGSPPTVQQVCTGNSFSTSTTAICGSNITNGDVLVAVAIAGNGVTLPTNPSGCVTWTQATPTGSVNSAAYTLVWSVGPVTSTAACTVTETGSGTSSGVWLTVWDLKSVLTTVDASPTYGFDTSFGASINGPSVTTTVSGDMILTVGYYQNSGVTANTPFTTDYNASLTNAGGLGIAAHYVQPSSGAVNVVYSSPGTSFVAMATIAIKP